MAIYNASGTRLGTSGIAPNVLAPGMKNNHIGAAPICRLLVTRVTKAGVNFVQTIRRHRLLLHARAE